MITGTIVNFLIFVFFHGVWFLLVLWTKPEACAYEASTLPLNYTPKLFFFPLAGAP